MSLTVNDVVTIPRTVQVMGWGEVRLSPGLFRDLITYCVRKSSASKYVYAVDLETAQFLNEDDLCPVTISGNYRPARQEGTRIGSYDGADVHVFNFPCVKNCLMIMCLDDDGNVVHQETSLLKPVENQINLIPEVTRRNVAALNGKFGE